MRAEIRPAAPEDIPALAAAMRAADVAEVLASSGQGPDEALRASLAISTQAWTGLIDGEPVCMFGVAAVSILSGRGAPWMLGADRLERYPMTFLRRCRSCVAAMSAVYPSLENYVDERNTLSKRWLGWLGFKLADETITLRNGFKFRQFKMEAGNV